ncbi:MAG: tetratricopeptide repeat protein [Methanoregulaceae archaeon]|nr:tetratricopeptide repeat protein [Methanoregulaceae archaeon]
MSIMPRKYNQICLFFLAGLILCCGITAADNIAAIDHYNKAVGYAYGGEYFLALNETDRALSENPNFSLAHVTRAGILNALGRYNESLDASDQAITLNNNQSEAWNNKAYALIQLGRYAEGLDASEHALILDPSLAEAWINKGTALIALGRYEEALAASEKAIELDPTSDDAKQNRYNAEAALKDAVPTRTPLPFPCILVACLLGAWIGVSTVIRDT